MHTTKGGKLKVSPKKILERYIKIKDLNKSKNVVIGFGITEKTIKSLKKADGLVVGSAICKEISAVGRNPGAREHVLTMTSLGFALVEALALFALIIALLLLFVF
jgi:F0F1-type ATP synthase membrane subunit c/vacuolar-type H+-ATPase subunit K